MDVAKYPLEKVFDIAAGVIPGSVALWIFEVSHPGKVSWLFGCGFLGYRTKLALILLAALVVGNTMTAFLTFLLGAIGGAVGAALALGPYRPPHSYDVAPWRDPTWRALVRKRLGEATPPDTVLMSKDNYDLRTKLIESMPEEQRHAAQAALMGEHFASVQNDARWANWYDYYHQIVLQPSDADFRTYVHTGLTDNLKAAALYVLLSTIAVPQLRHWWWILPACIWVALLLAEVYRSWHRFNNRWSTLSEQYRYLSTGNPGQGN